MHYQKLGVVLGGVVYLRVAIVSSFGLFTIISFLLTNMLFIFVEIEKKTKWK